MYLYALWYDVINYFCVNSVFDGITYFRPPMQPGAVTYKNKHEGESDKKCVFAVTGHVLGQEICFLHKN